MQLKQNHNHKRYNSKNTKRVSSRIMSAQCLILFWAESVACLVYVSAYWDAFTIDSCMSKNATPKSHDDSHIYCYFLHWWCSLNIHFLHLDWKCWISRVFLLAISVTEATPSVGSTVSVRYRYKKVLKNWYSFNILHITRSKVTGCNEFIKKLPG